MNGHAPGTWICPEPLDRVRLLEMAQRNRTTRAVALGVFGVAVALSAPWIGWWPLALLACAGSLFLVVERRLPSLRRPEVGAFISWAVMQAVLAAGIALTGGPASPVLVWLVAMIPPLAVRFRPAVVAVGSCSTLALLALTTAPVDPVAFVGDPVPVIATAAAIVVVGAITSSIMQSDRRYRGESVLDPLTGLLNRHSLEGRFEELRGQAELAGAGVALIVVDVDHFKVVNDEHGHEKGDEVLQALAYIMRKAFRQFELIYRLGGEEFLVVLPGMDARHAMEAAERLVRLIEESRPANLAITISAGVAAGASTEVVFSRLFAAADAALYEAKRGGRNRVVVDVVSRNGVTPLQRRALA